MTISENLTQLGGLPVVDYRYGGGLPEVESRAWRLRAEWDGPPFIEHVLNGLLNEPERGRVRGLTIGMYTDDSYGTNTQGIIDHLVTYAGQLPSLRALFLGDMTYEECEISWIHHGDVTQLLEAFPNLEVFGVRGGTEEITVRPVEHRNLRHLTFETGGMPAKVVQAVSASTLPALEHLELWLGTSMYGGEVTVADLHPILSGAVFPSLRHLGLRDAEIVDEIAAALAVAPVVGRLTSLDLSLGTLSDAGALALLNGQPLDHLEHLDLRHHYLSDEVMAAFDATVLQVDLGDRQEPDEGERYVAVGE